MEHLISKTVATIREISVQVGMDAEEQEQEQQDFTNQLSTFCAQSIMKAKEKKQQIESEVVNLRKELIHLRKCLGEEISQVDSTLPLRQQQKLIHKQLAQLRTIHQNRMETIRELSGEVAQLRSELGDQGIDIDPSLLESSDIGTIERVSKFKNAIERLKAEKARRRAETEDLRNDIAFLWTELEVSAETEFEKLILNTPSGQFSLHHESVRMLTQKKRLLEEKRAERLKERETLQAQVKKLREMLKIDPRAYAAFEKEYQGGLGARVIQKYREELKKLQDQKKDHLAEFIQDARLSLKLRWDSLFYSEEERQEFTPAFTSVISEESLLAHEREMEKLDRIYESKRQLLELLQSHVDLTKEIEEFEESTNDPERLTSRSSQRDPGRLLREEKFRKKVSTQLPRLEASLRESLAAYQASTGQPFLVFGRDYLEKMAQLEQARYASKKTPMKAKPAESPRKNSQMATPSKAASARPSLAPPLTPSSKQNLPKSMSTPASISKMAVAGTPSLKRKFDDIQSSTGALGTPLKHSDPKRQRSSS